MDTNPAKYFEPFAERLDKFISEHNLAVEKYRHELARWVLRFQHPLGGHGRIVVGTNGEYIQLQKWWTVDDYDQLTRRSTHEIGEKIDNPLECMEDKILEAIKDILSWDEGRLKPGGGLAHSRAPLVQPHYPTPIL